MSNTQGGNGYSPPDTNLAVGPNHVIETVNAKIAIYNKATGAQLSQQSLGAFFSPIGATGFQFDPSVYYDELAGRFVVECLDVTSSPSASYVDFAVSNSSDPTQGFSEMHRIDVTEYDSTGTAMRTDFDRLGWNADAYVITADIFPSGVDVINNVEVRTIHKSTVLDQNNATYTDAKTDLAGTGNFFLSPAAMHGATAGGPMWFVEESPVANDMRVVRETNVLGAPTFTSWDIPVNAYSDPPPAAQPGGTQINTDGDNVWNAAFRNNRLVASQTVNSNGVAHARWYEFNTGGFRPTLTQQGEINPGAGVASYFPVIDIDPAGDLGMTFLESSTTQQLSVWVTGQKFGGAAGVMDAPVLLQGGQTVYTDSGGSPYRAGDYNGIAVDPTTGSFWSAGEFAALTGAGDNWATWIGNFSDGASTTAAASLGVAGFPTSVTAGAPGSITVTAKDSSGKTVPNYAGTVHFSSSDPQAALPANYTFTYADQGVHTFSVTLKTAGTQSITATDTSLASVNGSQTGITVVAGAATSLGLTAPASAITATAFNVTVTAKDAYGNVSTGYTGTVHFSSTDGSATLPTNYTFTALDHGTHTFASGVTLRTLGNQTLTVTDTAQTTLTASTVVNVASGNAAASFAVAGFPASVTAGTAGSITVSAKDSSGQPVTNYTGTVHFSSTDPQAALPLNYTFTLADQGVHTFSVTLKTAGSQSVTATDVAKATVTGTQAGITVNAAAAAKYRVSGFPSPGTAGTAGSFTVTAQDAYGNTATGYTGTATFSSSDAKAVLPASYAFTAADHGVHTFTATLKTAATQTLTATDAAQWTITGSQGSITVNAAAASQLVLTAPSSAAVGAPVTVRVTAKDPYGNVATGYTGTVHFSSTDASATLPVNYTFVSTDKGVHTFTSGVTFRTLGNQTLSVVDTVQGALAASATLSVSSTPPPAAPSNLTTSFISSTSIGLQWTDNSNNESGFNIERSTDGVHFTQVGSVGANVTSFTDTGLAAHTTYYYRVYAFNSGGNSPYSNVVQTRTI